MIEFSPANIRMWSRLGACGAFGAAAVELGNTLDHLAITTADLCFYSGLNRFKDLHPDKLYNIGIAEQNMLGVAAGMAKEGMTVLATTYATFATTRCLDQVRVNMGYMKLPVKLIGLTAGFTVGILGATHMANEDIAIMRSIPNIVILSPADCTETVKAVLAAVELNAPVYIRLTGAMGTPIVYKQDYDYKIGKADVLQEGTDIAIVATGTMVSTALNVAERLQSDSISCKVVNMHTIKPIDTQSLDHCCKVKLIVTIEEHSKIGGLGSAVAEALSGKKNTPPQLILGVKDEYAHAASYPFLLNQYGLTPEKIYADIINKYAEE